MEAILDRILLIGVSGLLSSLLTITILWLTSLHKRQEKQGDALSQLKENLPREYVLRDDFVRWSIKIDQKIDKLFALIRKNMGGPEP